MKCLAYGSLALSIALAGVSPIFFKLAMGHLGAERISLGTVKAFLTNRYAIIGFTLYLLSSVLWLISMSKLNVSLMYPLLSLAYVITVVLADVYLNEPVKTLRWIGVALIIAGSVLVGMN